MKERESILVCPYFVLKDKNIFKAVPFLKAKCFHQNAFFNDLNCKEPEVETPVKMEELKAAKEARSEILHTRHKVNGYGILERNACFIRIYQEAYRKVKYREIQQNQTQLYKKDQMFYWKINLKETHIYTRVDKFSKNLGFIPKFQALESCLEVASTLKPHKYQAPIYKI